MTTVTQPAFDTPFVIGGREFRSRLMVGTGKYASNEHDGAGHRGVGRRGRDGRRAARGSRPDEGGRRSSITSIPSSFFLLANTAGCYNADEAVRYARLARAAGFNEWVKLEVIGDQETLLPDTAGLLDATRVLAAEGFKVMAYTNDDLITALRLEDAGAVAVMPLASPIGVGLGVAESLRHPHHQAAPRVPVIVDAGVGTASDACVTMEQGVDGILMNTGIAAARRSGSHGGAMRCAVEAGRLAHSSRDACRGVRWRFRRRRSAGCSHDGRLRTSRRAGDGGARRRHRRRASRPPTSARTCAPASCSTRRSSAARSRSTRATVAGRRSSCTGCCAGARGSTRVLSERVRGGLARLDPDLIGPPAARRLSAAAHAQRAAVRRDRADGGAREAPPRDRREQARERRAATRGSRAGDDRSRPSARRAGHVTSRSDRRTRADAFASALARRALGGALGRRRDRAAARGEQRRGADHRSGRSAWCASSSRRCSRAPACTSTDVPLVRDSMQHRRAASRSPSSARFARGCSSCRTRRRRS